MRLFLKGEKMKLGEIKAEAYRLMFADIEFPDFSDEQYLNETLETIEQNPNYSEYANGMAGAINRCFASLENKRVIPEKRVNIAFSKIGKNRAVLSDIADDIHSIDRISYIDEDKNLYIPSVDYAREGRDTLILDVLRGGEYTLIYYPKIPMVKSTDGNSREIDLPDDIACLIPYFIKGELYRQDDANEAAEARNTYEAMVGELCDNSSSYYGCVDNVYTYGD